MKYFKYDDIFWNNYIIDNIFVFIEFHAVQRVFNNIKSELYYIPIFIDMEIS